MKDTLERLSRTRVKHSLTNKKEQLHPHIKKWWTQSIVRHYGSDCWLRRRVIPPIRAAFHSPSATSSVFQSLRASAFADGIILRADIYALDNPTLPLSKVLRECREPHPAPTHKESCLMRCFLMCQCRASALEQRRTARPPASCSYLPQ